MSKTTLTFGLAALVLVLGILATSARGATTGGGIITIDQSKIPFTINASGSYKLTSDLVETNQLVTPITINVPGVTIDLNGFSISGGSWGIYAAFAPLVTKRPSRTGSAPRVTPVLTSRLTEATFSQLPGVPVLISSLGVAVPDPVRAMRR